MPKARKPTSPNPELTPRRVAENRERAHRLDSDFEAMRPGDVEFDVGAMNPGNKDTRASAEKRQEYSKLDGEFLQAMIHSGGDLSRLPETEAAKLGLYIAHKGEQERRFQNRRLARATSIYAANEGLHLRMMMQVAKEHFARKIRPTGYALKSLKLDQPRTVVILLSDLHFGADLKNSENPNSYGADEESRRLGKILGEVLDYKSRYRDHTKLLILLNGDVIEGNLGHDLRSGDPLVEQKATFLSYLQAFLGACSATFPQVEVHCQPGNHGRDKMRHPGRATEAKWDGHEWFCYYALAQMSAGLPNVKFTIPFRAVSVIPVHGYYYLMSHGDTEIKLGDPDTKADANRKELANINALRTYGPEFALGAFGHFHKARSFPWLAMRAVFNGALIPPNGHARTSGYVGEQCGQWLWEATAEYPLGDMRFIDVGLSEDRDASLNRIIKPFRFASGGFSGGGHGNSGHTAA